MGLLDKLFGSKSKESETSYSSAVAECPHAVLVPRWENVKDMGVEDKITRYMCEACLSEFTPEEAAKLRDSINERLEASWEAQVAEEGAVEKD
jgi:hypothetical protein